MDKHRSVRCTLSLQGEPFPHQGSWASAQVDQGSGGAFVLAGVSKQSPEQPHQISWETLYWPRSPTPARLETFRRPFGPELSCMISLWFSKQHARTTASNNQVAAWKTPSSASVRAEWCLLSAYLNSQFQDNQQFYNEKERKTKWSFFFCLFWVFFLSLNTIVLSRSTRRCMFLSTINMTITTSKYGLIKMT